MDEKNIYLHIKRLTSYLFNPQTRKPANPQTKQGFTLLEVLVSVVIFSTALVLILNSFIRAIRVIDFSEDYFKAGLVLQTKMFEVFNSKVEEISSKAVFPDFDNRFKWELDVVKIEDWPLYAVNLKVLWEQGTREQSTSVGTYLNK